MRNVISSSDFKRNFKIPMFSIANFAIFASFPVMNKISFQAPSDIEASDKNPNEPGADKLESGNKNVSTSMMSNSSSDPEEVSAFLWAKHNAQTFKYMHLKLWNLLIKFPL